MKLSGKVKGKMNMYRSGEKFKQHMDIEVMGMQTSNDTYIIDKVVYSVTDMDGKKFGTKTDATQYKSEKPTGEAITDFKEFEEFLDSKKITGTEEILGHKCDVYDISSGVSLAVYNKRYVLGIRSPEFNATATAFDGSPSFTANEFEVPSDVDFNATGMGALDGLDEKNLKGMNKEDVEDLINKYKKK